MKNHSVKLAVYKLSDDSVGISIDQKEFETYIKQLNKYQNNPITYYKQEKKYSHVKNNDLLGAVKEYFKNQKTVIFKKQLDIHNISDFEMHILKENRTLKIQNFEHEKALQFLKDNNLLEVFIEKKLEKNITSYYSEYSRTFSERINIKNTKETVKTLYEIESYLNNNILYDEHKSASVYDYTRKVRVVSFSYNKYHVFLDNNATWVKDLFEKNKNKNNGFPYAAGKVLENSFLELLKNVENNATKKNSLEEAIF